MRASCTRGPGGRRDFAQLPADRTAPVVPGEAAVRVTVAGVVGTNVITPAADTAEGAPLDLGWSRGETQAEPGELRLLVTEHERLPTDADPSDPAVVEVIPGRVALRNRIVYADILPL